MTRAEELEVVEALERDVLEIQRLAIRGLLTRREEEKALARLRKLAANKGYQMLTVKP